MFERTYERMTRSPGDVVTNLARIRLRPKKRSDYDNKSEIIADEILPDFSNRALSIGDILLVIASINCEDDRENDLLVLSCGNIGWISAENVQTR